MSSSCVNNSLSHTRAPCRSPHTQDLRELLQHVKDSGVLVLFQSRNVLERPWCLLELYTAVMENVPIVALNCAGKGYDFGKAADLLLHLETKLSKLNPSAVQVLKQHGADPLDVAHVLSSAIPNIISVHLNTSASRIAIKATMVDLVKAMQAARPFPVTSSLEGWLELRGELDEKVKRASLGAGTISGTVKGQMMAKAGRADELAKEIVELKRAMEAERGEFKSELGEFKSREAKRELELTEERDKREAERAEHKTELADAATKSETKIEKLEAKIEKLEAKLDGL